MTRSTLSDSADARPWYQDITRYQWLVLVIASLGWIFDVFEGQIFVASMNEAMKALLPTGTAADTIDFYKDVAMASFLLGGAVGGIAFGSLSDRIGRTRTMILTILVYSGFTCVTAFAQNWWQMAMLRFLVAMGVGGEWAVASAMVAEVFPKRARARSLGIFHASSVFGTYLAVAAGAFIVGNPNLGWRWGFAVGALPALLTLWIRWRLHEPEQWVEARRQAAAGAAPKTGRVVELFQSELLRQTLVGVSLAAIGLATFWGVHVFGKDLLRSAREQHFLAAANLTAESPKEQIQAVLSEHDGSIKNWEMIGMLLVTTGGGIGLLCFGPLSERVGRRAAFLVFHLGGFASAVVLFRWLATADVWLLCSGLVVFGFLTLGMHAGYAIYFPELFPTRLRGTGGGFCFNGGRILAAPILVVRGWLRDELDYSLAASVTVLSFLFLLAVVVLVFAPETRGRDLPS